ncbi:MAG: Phosphorylated carbohydrates phosphatase [Frankiales bacterium]|nr:Phosphorylated carbohydrates phosphatase [Frankiales bacterium]
MSALKAVLWDMDGTLVDTEPYWIAAEYRLVEAWGGEWTQEDAHRLIGNPLLVSAEYIREHGGVDLPPPQIVDLLLADVIRDCRDAVPWRPGARELLAELSAARVPCALVTMSYAELARAVVEQLPTATFATLVTGDELEHGKPHPEAYLTAAARLGVAPADTVAIEDSLPGVASAEAAGCVVLSVPSHVPIPPAPTRTLRDTLVGVDLPWLAALLGR